MSPVPDAFTANTVVSMVAGQYFVYAAGWLGCGLLLRGSGRGAGLGWWAAFMLCIGVGFWLVAQRDDPRTWQAFVGSSIAFVTSGACLWRGLSTFTGVRGLGREQVATLAGAIVLLVAAGPALEHAPWRVALSYGALAWLIGRGAWTTYPALAREFGPRLAWIFRLLPLGIVAVLAGLVVAQLLAWPRALEIHRFNDLNARSMMAYVVIAAAFNFVFMGLLTTRLIGQLREQSLRDALTGLHNRRALDERLRALWSLRQRGQVDFSVAVLDLDHFKRINDRHGHHGGDEVLVQAAARLRAAAREGDTVARFGGEEFVVLMPGSGAGASAAAQRLHAAIAGTPFEVGGQPLRVTASVGLSGTEAADVDAEACIRRADEALYQAKAGGRNRVVVAGAVDSPDAAGPARPPAVTSSAPSTAA